jgi:hypothetical protein
MGADLVGLDGRGTDDLVEPARQQADVLAGVEDEIGRAEIDRGAALAEDGERGRIGLLEIVEEDAQGGIEILREVHEGVELGPPDVLVEAAPLALTLCEGLEGLQGDAHLHLRAVMDRRFNLAPSLHQSRRRVEPQRGRVFELHDLVDLREVRKAHRHGPELAAAGLGVPALEALVEWSMGLRLDRQDGLDQLRTHLLALGQPEEPVDRDAAPLRDGDESLGPGQAVIGWREQLRQGRAVHADMAGEGGVVEPGLGDGLLQPIPEPLRGRRMCHLLLCLR